MVVLIAHNLAPIMFVSLVAFMLMGYPIAFSLAANGIIYFAIGIVLAPLAPGEINLSWNLLHLMPDRAFSVMANEILLALPFFTFMGLILERSGMAEDLLDTIGQLFGRVPGGLAYSVVFVGALLAATTGVVAASIIAMGLISLPIMLRYGYDRSTATGAIIASGTLAQIIPPSIVLIVLADQVGRPVGDMYQGAILPGLLLAALYAGWILLLSVVRPKGVPGLPAEAMTHNKADGSRGLLETGLLVALSALGATVLMSHFGELPRMDTIVLATSIGALIALATVVGHRLLDTRPAAAIAVLVAAVALAMIWRSTGPESGVFLADVLVVAAAYVTLSAALRRLAGRSLTAPLSERVALVLVPPLLLIFLVLGTIFIGLATPTEGGAMGAVGAVALAAFKRWSDRDPRRLNMTAFVQAAESTARLTAFVMFILIGARIFSMTFYAVNGHEWIEELLTAVPGGEMGFLLLVLTVVFILGFFLEFFEIAFVIIPLVLPAAVALEIDLIWFGVLLAIVVQTSYLTPPLGFGLFFLRSVAPEKPTLDTVTGRTLPGISTVDMYRGVVPFIVLQCICVILVLVFPDIVMHYKGDAAVLEPGAVNDRLMDIPLPDY